MPRAPAEQLALALSLWQGPVLADFRYEPVTQAEISRLDELRPMSASNRCASAALNLARLPPSAHAYTSKENDRGNLRDHPEPPRGHATREGPPSQATIPIAVNEPIT